MKYKYDIGDVLVLNGRGKRWEGYHLVRVIRYQDDIEYKYVIKKIHGFDEYGATEECLRKLTKLEKALK